MTRASYARQAAKRRRRLAVGGALIAVIATLASACSSGSSSSSPKSGSSSSGGGGGGGGSGKSLVVAAAELPTGFTLDAGGGGAGYENLEAQINTEAGLIRQKYIPDPQNPALNVQDLYNFEGVLASKWTESADHLTYTFFLKKGIKSAAGNPFTAADVVYSWDRKFALPASITPGAASPVITDPKTQIKEVNPYEVSFHIAKAGYGFTLLELLANLPGEIYDSTLLKQHASSSDPYAIKWSVTNPNFSYGPYMQTASTTGTEMDLSANPNYPLAAPAYSKLIFRVTADPGSRSNAVKNGNADVGEQLYPSDQATLAKSSNVKVYSFPSTNMITMFTFNTTEAPFNNVKVRQAMALAVPYNQILQNVYYGRAILTRGVLDPGLPGYISTGLNLPSYNPTEAKAMLAAAGFPNGVSATITVDPSVPDVVQAAIQIQSEASAAGFNIKIQQVPTAEFQAGEGTRKFQSYMWRDMAISSAPQYVLGLFFKNQGDKPSPNNGSGWYDPSYINTIDAGASLPSIDSAAANQLWHQAALISQAQAPMLWIARVQPLNAFSSKVVGYSNRLDNDIDFSTLKPAS
jgi:peptide/nickel transport system substrate-binding protein